jgi:N-acetylglucosamine-6-phosphate deacetylase
MTSLLFTNGQILRPDGFSDTPLGVSDELIVEESIAGESVDLDGGYLLPGFIDTQVNGGGDVLFNDEPTVAAIAAIGAAHRRYGTTTFLPTLISDTLDKVEAAMRATERAIDEGIPGVAGIHLEGPFLAAARRGTHDPIHFRTLEPQAIRLLSSLRKGRTLVTLAPETCTPDDIRALRAAGVVVAAGHTNATYDVMREAFTAGVTGVTHLFNAMSPLDHRAPGVVGATLDDQSAYVGVIIDGRHVDTVALRIAMRARPRDRFMIVTDAMPTVGSATKRFTLQGKDIRVVDGVCVGENGTLAGSDLDMVTAVRNAVQEVGLGLDEAATMAATSPSRFLGLVDRGALMPGRRADLVWLDRSLRLRGVWQGGVAQGIVSE